MYQITKEQFENLKELRNNIANADKLLRHYYRSDEDHSCMCAVGHAFKSIDILDSIVLKGSNGRNVEVLNIEEQLQSEYGLDMKFWSRLQYKNDFSKNVEDETFANKVEVLEFIDDTIENSIEIIN